MKTAAFAFLLLLAGCLPANFQELVIQDPSVKFVLESSVKDSYTAFVFSTHPGRIRSLVVQGEGLYTPDDPSCEPWEALPGSISCGKGEKIRAAPGGYRLNLQGPERPVGTVCIIQGETIELLFCSDLEPLPSL